MKSLDEIFEDVCEVIESSTGINKNEIKQNVCIYIYIYTQTKKMKTNSKHSGSYWRC